MNVSIKAQFQAPAPSI